MARNPLAIKQWLEHNEVFIIDQAGIDEVWNLHGKFQALKSMFVNDDETEFREYVLIDALIDITGEYYLYITTIRSSVTSADYNKLARTLQTTGEMIHTIRNFRDIRNLSLPALLSEGLSNILQYLGGTSYITSALAGCEAVVNDHALQVYDHFWDLFREISARDKRAIANFAKVLDKTFQPLLHRQGKLESRIIALAQLYRLLYYIYLLNFSKLYIDV